MNAVQPLLEATELSAGYEGPVVGPLSFSVSPGEVLVLSGPNGSGKSTLLAAVLGTARIFSGDCRLGPGVELAWQCQQDTLPAEFPMTARELLALAGGDAGRLPADLRSVVDRRLDQLSGGQRQLMRVWAAIASPASLLLLDEPTNSLDPHTASLLSGYLQSLPGHRGVVLVCHESAFVRQVAHRVVEVA